MKLTVEYALSRFASGEIAGHPKMAEYIFQALKHKDFDPAVIDDVLQDAVVDYLAARHAFFLNVAVVEHPDMVEEDLNDNYQGLFTYTVNTLKNKHNDRFQQGVYDLGRPSMGKSTGRKLQKALNFLKRRGLTSAQVISNPELRSEFAFELGIQDTENTVARVLSQAETVMSPVRLDQELRNGCSDDDGVDTVASMTVADDSAARLESIRHFLSELALSVMSENDFAALVRNCGLNIPVKAEPSDTPNPILLGMLRQATARQGLSLEDVANMLS